MPPIPKRNRCIILFDLLSQNIQLSRKALLKIYAYQSLSCSIDDIDLILVNSERTDNENNRKCRERFQHVMQIDHLTRYDPMDVSEKLEEKACNSSNCSSWIEAIILALDLIESNFKHFMVNNQILFITDLVNFKSVPLNSTGKSQFVQKLNKFKVIISFVGVDVDFPQTTITDLSQIQKMMKNLKLPDDCSQHVRDVKELLFDRGVKGTISNFENGIPLFLSYHKKMGNQAWNIPLTFHETLQIPVAMCKYEKDNKMCLTTIRTRPEEIFVSSEDCTIEYSCEEVSNGLFLHDKFLKVDDDSIFKIETEKSLKVVYVAPLNTVPEYMMKGPLIHYVIPKGTEEDEKLFCLLLKRCRSRRLCIIVSRVYSKNSQPSFFAMVPTFNKRKYFIAIQLPFSHEIGFVWNERDPEQEEIEEDFDVEVTDFLQKITINSPNCELNLKFTPNVLPKLGNDPILNKWTDKYLSREVGLDEINFRIIPNDYGAIGNRLKEIWPVRTATTDLPVVDENDPTVSSFEPNFDEFF